MISTRVVLNLIFKMKMKLMVMVVFCLVWFGVYFCRKGDTAGLKAGKLLTLITLIKEGTFIFFLNMAHILTRTVILTLGFRFQNLLHADMTASHNFYKLVSCTFMLQISCVPTLNPLFM